MKRFLYLVLATLLIVSFFAMSASAATERGTKCAEVKYEVAGCNTAPKLDGKIEDGEYSAIPEFSDDYHSAGTYNGSNISIAWAVKYKAYATYDKDYFYVAFEAPAGEDYVAKADILWKCHMAMIAVSLPSSVNSRADYEICMGRDSITGDPIDCITNSAVLPEAQTSLVKAKNLAVGYKEGKTVTYEARIPWSWIGKSVPTVGSNICYSFSIGVGIGADDKRVKALGGNVEPTTAEDGLKGMGTVTLTAAPKVEQPKEDPPKEEQPKEDDNDAPKTGDEIYALVAILVASASALTVIRKKSGVR